MGKNIRNIFDWLEEITYKKSPPESFSDEDWEKFNSYMIHRFISHNIDYIEVVNMVQTMPPLEKKKIYTIYREYIPKRKTWFKYIKNQNKVDYKGITTHLSKYFECSSKEANEYIALLDKETISEILQSIGQGEKEIKKLLKEAKL